jgi:hypothetical protein
LLSSGIHNSLPILASPDVTSKIKLIVMKVEFLNLSGTKDDIAKIKIKVKILATIDEHSQM